jgi:hypothetical protein
MKKKSEFDSKFDKVPNIPDDHFHYDMICPYQEYFSCPFRGGLQNVETWGKSPTALLTPKQKRYLEELKNYMSFQKTVMPKMRKAAFEKYFKFGSLADELDSKCWGISFMNVIPDNGYLVCCARMDREMDLIFLCIVLKPESPIDERLFENGHRLILKTIEDEKKLEAIRALQVRFCRYFYFSCGHWTIPSGIENPLDELFA